MRQSISTVIYERPTIIVKRLPENRPLKGGEVIHPWNDKLKFGLDRDKIDQKEQKYWDWFGFDSSQGGWRFWVPSAFLGLDYSGKSDAFIRRVLVFASTLKVGFWCHWHEEDQYIQLSHHYLRTLLTKEWHTEVIQFLEDRGAIKVDRHYRMAREHYYPKCMGYKLANGFRSDIVVVWIRNKSIEKTMARLRAEAGKLHWSRYPLFVHLRRYYETNREAINHIGFAKSIRTLNMEDKSEKSQMFHQWVKESFENKDFFSSIDPNTGRMFNNLSNCPREMRKHLVKDGEPLCEVDVGCCQALLMVSLYDLANDEAERVDFLETVIYEDFYETIKKETLRIEPNWYFGDRKNLKQQIFKEVMFTKGYDLAAPWYAFAHLFPSLARVIEALRAKDPKFLPRMLQTDEASIIYSKILPELMDQGIFCATVHDSIVCLGKDVDAVIDAMQRHFGEHVGATPRLGVRYGDGTEKDIMPSKLTQGNQ